MMDPSAYVGEIRLFAGDKTPIGWLDCDGRMLSSETYNELYSVIVNIFGGTPHQKTFALPDFRAYVPMGASKDYQLGKKVGQNSVALKIQNLPSHTHGLRGFSNSADNMTNTPSETSWLSRILVPGPDVTRPPSAQNFATGVAPDTSISADTIAYVGNGTPHDNQQPYLALRFCICAKGLYPDPGEGNPDAIAWD